MFLSSVLIAIMIGLLLKGDIKNINSSNLKGIYFAFTAFIIEIILFTLVRNKILNRNLLTYAIYLLEYIFIFLFVFLNRKNKAILILGFGFLLNAVAIFTNGGAMPVSPQAVVEAGLSPSINDINLSSEGLYILENSKTNFSYLGDVIPTKFIRHYVISPGDIIISLGIILFIITEMKRKPA